jgi:1-phosphatidylinositol-3-phosphate 5-kinase
MHAILGPLWIKSNEVEDETVPLNFETMDADLLISLSKKVSQNSIKVSFESMLPRHQYSCEVTIYYPVQFAALRRLFCGGDSAFVYSMARSQKWEAKEQGGGASKASFVHTRDGLFFLKSVPSVELKQFQAFAGKYFEYLLKAASTGMPTIFVKILGMFSVDIKNPRGVTERVDFIVMEKLFNNRAITQTFDLKGSVRNRLRPDGAVVLQDENLRRMMWSKPLVIDDQSKAQLGLAIWNDSYFLSKVSVMDYSILVGVDEKGGVLEVGIIDYIRPYSWDKMVEYVMKSTPGIISGSQKKPTVISPNDYRDRFRLFTWNCFIMTPTRNAVVLLVEGKECKEPEEEVPLVVVAFDE